MKINRYSSEWLGESFLGRSPLLATMARVSRMSAPSGNVIRSGQRWASCELSEVNICHIFPSVPEIVQEREEAKSIYLISIWTFNKKSKIKQGRACWNPYEGFSLFSLPTFMMKFVARWLSCSHGFCPPVHTPQSTAVIKVPWCSIIYLTHLQNQPDT